MKNGIILEWDESKRQKVLTERGIDFADTAELLADPNVAAYQDERQDYGEVRMNAYGFVDGQRMRVCFTPRDGRIRVITMFKVGKKEWSEKYEKNY